MKLFKTVALAAIVAMMPAITISAKEKKEKKQCTFTVTVDPLMHCNNCVNKIESNIRFEKGVKKVKADLPTETVTITYDPAKTDSAALISSFAKIGYTASPAK